LSIASGRVLQDQKLIVSITTSGGQFAINWSFRDQK